jgi:hypothetical protein
MLKFGLIRFQFTQRKSFHRLVRTSMISHSLYDIKNDETFDQLKYGEISQELDRISRAIFFLPGNHKSDIVISFLKDHTIRKDYLETNKRVIEKIISTSLPTCCTEALFNSCQNNPNFLRDFENFIKTNFN